VRIALSKGIPMGAKYVVYDREWMVEKIKGLLNAADESDTGFEKIMLVNQVMPDIDSYVEYMIQEQKKLQQEKDNRLEILEIIETWHNRLGCNRQCDKMNPALYHQIHSKMAAAPTPDRVMTPPREAIGMSDMKPEEVGSKYDVNLPEAQPLYKNPQA